MKVGAGDFVKSECDPSSRILGCCKPAMHRFPPTQASSPDAFFALAYEDLKRLAHARLRRSEAITLLDTTSLVHETYLRMSQRDMLEIPDRSRFLAYASQAMRSILVDFVRRRDALRHGGGDVKVPCDETPMATSDASEILRVHEALNQLGAIDQRLVRVVEMRYFAGLSDEEISDALEVTPRTVRRDWKRARLLLSLALA